MDNNNKIGSVTVAFLIGAVAGGIAALLFAPQSGTQMRRRLKLAAQDLHAKGVHLAHDVEEKAETVTGAMKGAVSAVRDTYRDELERRHVAWGTETKRDGETETAGKKMQTGARP